MLLFGCSFAVVCFSITHVGLVEGAVSLGIMFIFCFPYLNENFPRRGISIVSNIKDEKEKKLVTERLPFKHYYQKDVHFSEMCQSDPSGELKTRLHL